MDVTPVPSVPSDNIIDIVHMDTCVRAKSRRFKTDKNGCYLCWKNFPTLMDLQNHFSCHKDTVIARKFNASWRSQRDHQPLTFSVELIAGNLIFQICNTTSCDIKIVCISVFNDILQFGKLNPNEFPIEVKMNDKVTLQSTLHGVSKENHYVILYETEEEKHIEKVQSYQVQLQLQLVRLHSTMQNALTSEANNSIGNTLQAQRINDILRLRTLPRYLTPLDIQMLCYSCFSPNSFLSADQHDLLKKINEFQGPLTPENYVEMLTIMIQIEDFNSQLAMNNSTKNNRQLIRRGKSDFAIKLSELEGRPLFLLKGDSIWVGHNARPYFRVNGYVEKVTSDEISMKLYTFNGECESAPCYSIHFEVNRLTYLMEREALKKAYDMNIIHLLFPNNHEQESTSSEEATLPKLQYFDTKVKSDVSQMDAVRHIVAGTAYPLPYLLIGYPGTGKTKVIVESVCQLFAFPQNRILVCASSNSVCDEIAEKIIALIKVMRLYQTPVTEQYNIIRLYAATVRRTCKGEELLENSNFEEKSIPCLDEIYKYRIVVCTLTVSGRLSQGDIDANHFTHLFIDECENAAETYTLIPIAGVCSSPGKINAHIVMSGDPKQLGPIVRSTTCKNMQLDISMFQRLFLNEAYQKDKTKKAYNSRLITKLRNNYRSHPDLVKMPNQLFYNNEMRTSANIVKLKWLSELPLLPKPGFPIFFENIEGSPETKENCLSWYNDAEMESVLHYVDRLINNKPKKISPSDIGIISPYKRQCIHIEEALENAGFTGIEVGSVEQFQGKEKPIIIISTVRKGPIGFLQQRERINVMLTRAIGLLIIIGHRETLCKNCDWKRIIDYISDKCDGEMVVHYFTDDDVDEDYRC